VEPRLFPGILAIAAASRAAILLGLKLVNESLGGSFPCGASALARAVEFLRRQGHGFILAGGVSDGAAFMAVETAESARGRRARIYAQVEVVEESFDPQRAGNVRECFCLVEALRKARESGQSVPYRGRSRWGGTIRLRLSPVR
jgi:3-oxoacyl-(acyl-carrier-protein) synthase